MKNLLIRFFKRRKFLVHKKFQLTFIIVSFSYVILFCAVMGTCLFIPLMMELDESEIGSAQALEAAKRILYLN